MKLQAEVFAKWQRGSKEDPITRPTEKIKVHNLVYEVPEDVVEYMVNIQAAYEIAYKEKESALKHWQNESEYNITVEVQKYAERNSLEFKKSAIMCFKNRHINEHGYDYCYHAFLDYKYGCRAWRAVAKTIEIMKTNDLNKGRAT